MGLSSVEFALVLHIIGFSCLFVSPKANEELVVKDLGYGFTAFHFNFVSKTHELKEQNRHYDFLPRQILELINKYHVNELYLSISKGFWDEMWGSNFEATSPSGAELLVWFNKEAGDVDHAWFEVTHALSGIFCASLNHLSTRQHFTAPHWSYRPSGLAELSENKILGSVRYAQLPGEALCSENLTPWTKFLPCKRISGLGSLLLPTSLFKANYNSLSVRVRRVCTDQSCRDVELELSQKLTIVFDRRLIYDNIKLPWSITTLLGKKYEGNCEAVDSSDVLILNSLTPSSTPIKTDQFEHLVNYSNDDRLLFSLPTSDLFNLSSPLASTVTFKSDDRVTRRLPLITVTKYVTGSGNIRGGVKLLLISRADFPIKLICFDLIPWYIQVLFNSLRIHAFNPRTEHRTQIDPERMIISPSLARQRLGSLEMVLTLPANHQLIITYQFKKALQRWDEFPPDANHGFYLPSAVISYQLTDQQVRTAKLNAHVYHQDLLLPNWASTYQQLFNYSITHNNLQPGDGFVRQHTPVSLVSMPTPDFSMPFNVLCFVCSLISIIFGSIHKTTTSTIAAKLPQPNGKARLKLLFERLRSRLMGTNSHAKED